MAISKGQMQTYYSDCTLVNVATNNFLLTYKCPDRSKSEELETAIEETVATMPTGSGAKFKAEFTRTFGSNLVTYLSVRVEVGEINSAMGVMKRQPQPSDWKSLASRMETLGEMPLRIKLDLQKKIDAPEYAQGRRS